MLRSLRPIRASLGASGAVLACFAAAASFAPDKQVAFIFAPTVSFPIITGLQVRSQGSGPEAQTLVQRKAGVRCFVVSESLHPCSTGGGFSPLWRRSARRSRPTGPARGRMANLLKEAMLLHRVWWR